MRRLTIIFAVFASLMPLLLVNSAYAAHPKVYQSSSGIAINGVDPVAYFTQSKPVDGKADITHEYNGATWLFSSTENRDKFAANPEKYAPQYGGYCAFAVSKGYPATTVPEAWSVVDGKLYLNYSLSVRKQWRTDTTGFIAKADKNWPDVLNK